VSGSDKIFRPAVTHLDHRLPVDPIQQMFFGLAFSRAFA
jgi:hypothetical protein